MSTIQIDMKTIVGWGTLAALIVSGMAVLISFGPPVSMRHMAGAEVLITQNQRRSKNNREKISTYSSYVNKLRTESEVDVEYRRNVRQDLLDAKDDRKEMSAQMQKILNALNKSSGRNGR